MAKAYIIASVRTAVGRAYRGSLKDTRRTTWARRRSARRWTACEPRPGAHRRRDPRLRDAEGEQGMNVAASALLRRRCPKRPAMTINRFLLLGLQAIAMAAERILAGSPTWSWPAAPSR